MYHDQAILEYVKKIRESPDNFDRSLGKRGIEPIAFKILDAYKKQTTLITKYEGILADQNVISRSIGVWKRNGQNTESLESQATELRRLAAAVHDEIKNISGNVSNLLQNLPNVLDDDVPEGVDETHNRVVYEKGKKREFSFEPKQHFDIGEQLEQMDFKMAARISGPRFTILSDRLARLERALGQFMIDVHTREHGYTEMSVPVLVKEAALFGTGQLPKFKDDLFETSDGRWLIPTSEVSLTNIAADGVFVSTRLPLRLTALTPCFRAEAGSAGRDVRGMFRQHQFTKVELVSITHPDESAKEHERMTRCAETILDRLGLPYRRVLLCAGDTGFSAAKTYDLEVWLPGQNQGKGEYREISSCSNTRAFQALRMKALFQESGTKARNFVHTLNGSGVAVGRALIAVLENYQNADGSICIPEALWPYMDSSKNITKISAA